MKIVFLAYREWALNVVESISAELGEAHEIMVFKTNAAFCEWFESKHICGSEVVVAIGWSWIIKKEITDSLLCVGVHPSDLPNYRGGSPIQNQIIDGLTRSKCSLFRISDRLDAGEIFGKVGLSLEGDSMAVILKNIEKSSIELLYRFISNYPNVEGNEQDLEKGCCVKRRKPEDGRLFQSDLNFENIVPLYNKIRCLTDPYPNAYIEDRLGNRIYFEKIRFSKAG